VPIEPVKTLQFMRAGVRVNSRIPVRLDWPEANETRSIDGQTMDISPRGCMAIAPHAFTVGQKLQIVNAISLKQCEAILIWRGHQARNGWELGIELLNPPHDFWEVDF
jgi:PilZ domain